MEHTVKLHNGVQIPVIALGVYQAHPGEETERAVLTALKAGYRHIDTAAYYQNEESVGRAIKKSGIPRSEIFVTTKLKNDDHADPARAFHESLRKLDCDYIDLYLIHWPGTPLRTQAWKVLEQLYKEKKVRAIGVSNYTIRHLKELLPLAEIPPMVNQVEFTPYLYQKELLDFCRQHNIVVEAYSPLTRGQRLDDPKLVALAKKYGRTPAQMLIKWCIQRGMVVLPKSVHDERIRQNFAVFDFTITDDDLAVMDGFDESLRTCWDPSNIA